MIWSSASRNSSVHESRATTLLADRPAGELALARLNELPTLAPVALQLVRTAADTRSTAGELAALVRADQSITSRLLTLANSAAFAGRSKITSLDQAIVMLGFRAVRNVALAVKLLECFPPAKDRGASTAFDRGEFWKHTLAVANAARRLAAARPQLGVDREDAYVAGLLHDIGKVALDAVFPRAYERIVATARQNRSDLLLVEADVLSVTHTIAGRKLAERWQLPAPLHSVVWLHHHSPRSMPSDPPGGRLAALVRLADTLVRENSIGDSGNPMIDEPAFAIAEQLGFEADSLEAVVPEVMRDVADQAQLLGLDRESPEAMYVRALTRARGELGRLNEDLEHKNRQLGVAARYFDAMTRLDRRLSACSDLANVVSAVLDSAAWLWPESVAAVFALGDAATTVDVIVQSELACAAARHTLPASAELRAWAEQRRSGEGSQAIRAPLAVCRLCEAAVRSRAGEWWLLPIAHGGQTLGGILLVTQADPTAHFADECDELASLLTRFGLSIVRTNAQATARRLADDLAEANRRLQQTQGELLRTRSLAMIAELAAGAGHELNNPLSIISGRAQLSLRDVPEDSEAHRALEQILTKAHECSRIVSDLMDFARPRPPAWESIPIRELLAAVQAEWEGRAASLGARIEVVLQDGQRPGAGDGATVRADRQQLRTILNELIENACSACEDRPGVVRVTWRRLISSDRNTADGVEFTVRDNGVGMTPTILQRVFDPFFSHRPAGRRRGLGLARVHRMVESHGGRVWLESRPNEGTAAHVSIPAGPPHF
jgi:putative nucleotidyltransferase with HDIG domain